MFKYQLAPFRPNHLLTDFRHLQVNRIKTLRGNEVFVLVAITIEHERHSHRRIRRNALRCHLYWESTSLYVSESDKSIYDPSSAMGLIFTDPAP